MAPKFGRCSSEHVPNVIMFLLRWYNSTICLPCFCWGNKKKKKKRKHFSSDLTSFSCFDQSQPLTTCLLLEFKPFDDDQNTKNHAVTTRLTLSATAFHFLVSVFFSKHIKSSRMCVWGCVCVGVREIKRKWVLTIAVSLAESHLWHLCVARFPPAPLFVADSDSQEKWIIVLQS